VSWLSVALLVCAVAVVVAAEWARLTARAGSESRARRERARKKKEWRVIKTETDDFAASVQRDLENLPTIEERDHKR
jgi:cell division protein FtsL